MDISGTTYGDAAVLGVSEDDFLAKNIFDVFHGWVLFLG